MAGPVRSNENQRERPNSARHSIRSIVGEEVDAFGKKIYELKWDRWHREDGTNTTWEYIGPESDRAKLELQKKWDRIQKDKRVAAARETLEFRFAPYPGQLWHEDAAVELAEGLAEKTREAEIIGDQRFRDWDTLPRLSDCGPDDEQNHSNTRSDRQNVAAETQRSRLRSTPRRNQSNIASPAQLNASPSSANSRRLRMPPVEIPDSDEELYDNTSTIASPKRRKVGPRLRINSSPVAGDESEDPRQALQAIWRSTARSAGAATISIINDVNAEVLPSLPRDFRYCEHRYVRAANLPDVDETFNCLVHCDCDLVCEDSSACECQGPSELTDAYGEKIFAYTPDRLFNFTLSPGTEVIECNKNCKCKPGHCSNRVAQLPRDVPIEIFRTQDRGWGVRATKTVERGKVLGILTGLLIRREDAVALTAENRGCVFDLDVHENGDEDDSDDLDGKYSVDCGSIGNWTRFVNHSCAPNMQVYPVVWDAIPEMNQPYLAFVAKRTIPAGTEFTIDYNPQVEINSPRSKGKGKVKMPRGAKTCFCGAQECRGWY